MGGESSSRDGELLDLPLLVLKAQCPVIQEGICVAVGVTCE